MVRLYDDFDGILKIWLESFDDLPEEVEYFYDNLKHGSCYALMKNSEPVSILYLVDCRLNGNEAKYVYAACTSKKYRNKGFMSELLDFVSTEYKNICLIPGDESLVSYYKKRGFDTVFDLSDLVFFENDEIKNEYLLEGCSLDKPIVLYKQI